MNAHQLETLKNLILLEEYNRAEFRRKRDELEALVDPITEHVRNCYEWWNANLPNADEVVVVMEDGTPFKILRPKLEVCKVESYLPFGVDPTEYKIIDYRATADE